MKTKTVGLVPIKGEHPQPSCCPYCSVPGRLKLVFPLIPSSARKCKDCGIIFTIWPWQGMKEKK